MRAAGSLLLVAAGCGRVNFGYPVVPCEDVVSLESTLGDNDHCYTRHAGPVAQNAARDVCHTLGGHLVTIASDEEQADVLRLSLTAPMRIGLSANGVAAPFSWDTNEALIFTAWGAGQPMYSTGITGVTLDGNGTWTTTDASEAGPFVCEIEPWHVIAGHGYRLVWVGGTWFAAEAYCESVGAHLASITSREEYDALALAFAGYSAWIGLRITGGVATWVTGEPVDFTAWQPGRPNTPGDTCAWMSSSNLWVDDPCSGAQQSICERDQ